MTRAADFLARNIACKLHLHLSSRHARFPDLPLGVRSSRGDADEQENAAD